MPQYIVERNIPGVGDLSEEQHRGGAENSLKVLSEMGPEIQWVQSYVTEDKIYCMYSAPNVDMIKEHADKAGIPADRISEIKAVIDPGIARDV